MMMNIDTNKLRHLAAMAAPGPWTINPNTDARFMVFSRRVMRFLIYGECEEP